jgi:protein tyrosine phosphatase (PTP) superfamily phosphohydrolase (DUF442 family)
MALKDINNFVPVDDRLATAGQPTEAQLADVAAAGFEAVVNLGLLDPSYCLRDEAGLTATLGLSYRHIPVKFDAPTSADLQTFVDTMDGLADRRVFVHCAGNYRVSVFMALFGELRLGWSRERADRLIERLWRPSQVWSHFLERCREELFASPPFATAAARFVAHLDRAGWPREIVWVREGDLARGDEIVVTAREKDERGDDAAWDYEVARAAGAGVALTAVCTLNDEQTCATVSASEDGRLTTNVPAAPIKGRSSKR